VVENHRKALSHQGIRFNILHALYQKHYGGQPGHIQITDEIIREAGLNNIDKNLVIGDIIYLKDKHLINGTKTPLGDAYPRWMIITSSGIDFVDNVIARFIEGIENLQVSGQVKSHVKELAKESNITKRIKVVIDYAQSVTALWLNIMSIANRLQGF
jgi:hypothetical protein